jgi:ubiquinol-cytochrome c reductase cytochrome c1 subunit
MTKFTIHFAQVLRDAKLFARSLPSLVMGFVTAATLFSAQAFAAGETCLPFGPAQTNPTDVPTLQRGAKLYFNYCAACHSIQYMRYSRLSQDLDLTEAQVMQNFAYTEAKFGDYVTNHMPAGGRGNSPGGTEWFGQAPPDLSLVARSRGVNWIYNYLKGFYPDPSRPVGWNNVTFPNASMPNPLWELQGVQSHKPPVAKPEAAGHGQDAACSPAALVVDKPGSRSAQDFDDDMQALTSFLEYVGEPAIMQRESIGVWVLLYLAGLTFLLWLLKNEFWKDVH